LRCISYSDGLLTYAKAVAGASTAIFAVTFLEGDTAVSGALE